MESDHWFYLLLKYWPTAFFEFLGISESEARKYRFDSVELKKGSFRLDGVFLPQDEALPVIFVEFQGYPLATYYANLFAKVFVYLEQNEPHRNWKAVAIFLERAVEPKQAEPYQVLLDSEHVTRIYLDELPPERDPSLVLGIWQLTTASKQVSRELAPRLVTKARHEVADGALSQQIVELIEELLIRKFPALSRKELRSMFKLHDIRETRVFQEGLEEGKVEERIATVRRLASEGWTEKRIAELYGIPVKEVRKLINSKG